MATIQENLFICIWKKKAVYRKGSISSSSLKQKNENEDDSKIRTAFRWKLHKKFREPLKRRVHHAGKAGTLQNYTILKMLKITQLFVIH